MPRKSHQTVINSARIISFASSSSVCRCPEVMWRCLHTTTNAGTLVATISQAYFHFQPYHVEGASLEDLSNLIAAISEQTATRAFDFDTTIEAILVPGSLRGWVTASAIFSTITVVSTYSDFKASVKEIYTDSKWFAQQVNELVVQKSDVHKSDIFRTERRTKATGRLKRLVDSLGTFEKRYQLGDELQSGEELQNLERELELVRRSFDGPELETIEKGLNAPGSPDRTIVLEADRFAIKPREPSTDGALPSWHLQLSGPTPPRTEHDLRDKAVIDIEKLLVPHPTTYVIGQEQPYIAFAGKPIPIVRRLQVHGRKRLLRH